MKQQPTSYCRIGNCPPVVKRLPTGHTYSITWQPIRRMEVRRLLFLNLAYASSTSPNWYYHKLEHKPIFKHPKQDYVPYSVGSKDNHNPACQLRRRQEIWWLNPWNMSDWRLEKIKKFHHLTEKKRRGCRFTRRWIKQQIGMIHSFDDAMDNEANLRIQFGATDRSMW